MDGTARRWTPERVVVIAALAFGVAAGSYGIANAAGGSGSSSGNAAGSGPSWPAASGSQQAPGAGHGLGAHVEPASGVPLQLAGVVTEHWPLAAQQALRLTA